MCVYAGTHTLLSLGSDFIALPKKSFSKQHDGGHNCFDDAGPEIPDSSLQKSCREYVRNMYLPYIIANYRYAVRKSLGTHPSLQSKSN